jgi:hypothetical protein
MADLAGGDLLGATNRARVAGSGLTALHWNGKLLSLCRQIGHQSGAPVAPPAPIHPLDSAYPVEIITPLAATMGQLTLEMYEMYGQQVWDQLMNRLPGAPGEGATDMVEVFSRVANTADPIYVTKLIMPPKLRGKTMAPYTYTYHNCVITDIGDGETIEVGTMEVLKTITIAYTHTTRGDRNIFSGPNQKDPEANASNIHNWLTDRRVPTGSR